VLARFGEQVGAALDAHEEAHYAVVQAHIEKHLLPFK
jgi:hypothetical protein